MLIVNLRFSCFYEVLSFSTDGLSAQDGLGVPTPSLGSTGLYHIFSDQIKTMDLWAAQHTTLGAYCAQELRRKPGNGGQ